MNIKSTIYILIASFFYLPASGQSPAYSVEKAALSSDRYDEFAPVFYKNGLVFSTNRNISLLNYSTSQDKGLFKIYFIDTTGSVDWQNARLFSKDITTKLNDGPAAFNSRKDTIYYSRNIVASASFRDISSPRNKLGIFYAVLEGNKWTKIREFRINNEWYNVTTPCLSPDSKRLYFASDKPGGFGGSDLYYCELKDNYWNDPVNLGPNINTKGNESFPYITPSGELLFSSDGHPGFGGKDIFFSRFTDTVWIAPIHLAGPINSEYDDFGIITDPLMNTGYFSSNREKSVDIFHFRTNIPQIFYNNIQKENQYCFMFSDTGSITVDTLNLEYVWDFGDGNKASGKTVRHCYSGNGKYTVKLDIVERATRNLFFSKLSYNIDIRDFEQPYINSPEISVKGDSIDFDGLKSYLPGNKILSYSWDFGDGTRKTGNKLKHLYKESGEYMVNLTLILRSDRTGKIRKDGSSKKIVVLNNLKEKSSNKVNISKSDFTDLKNNSNAIIKTLYSAENEFKQDAVFQVEIISSKTKIDLRSNVFNLVPKRYVVEEIYDSGSGVYSYIADQQLNLMATYMAFRDLKNAGFKNVRTKIEVVTDPAARELNNLKKNYGTSTGSYFDGPDKLTSNAYIMLDQIVKFMNKYPLLRLEVEVHSDNRGSEESNLSLTQRRSQSIVTFLSSRGISTKRLVANGLGGSRPIAPNILEKDRKLNQRLDFKIINN